MNRPSFSDAVPVAAPSATDNSSPVAANGRWQDEMKHAVRDLATLRSRLGLPISEAGGEDVAEAAHQAQRQFPVFVPPSLLQRIRPGDPADPILQQVLPVSQEQDSPVGFSQDPLQEQGANQTQPVLKKYQGRVLLVTTGVCGVHCRYCFRRHFPYQQLPQNRTDWTPWLEPVQKDDTINEVILSGGDPLVLNDLSLTRLCESLKQIPHVRWLRLHSRMPVVIPSRITSELLAAITGFAHTTMVLHINHAQEIDGTVKAAVAQLKQAGVSVLNQSVLLRGINDSVEALEQLSIQLIESGIQPYYLHQLDRVQGAAHFEVPQPEAIQLVEQLRRRLPGHAVPQYVREVPGQPYKTLIDYLPE